MGKSNLAKNNKMKIELLNSAGELDKELVEILDDAEEIIAHEESLHGSVTPDPNKTGLSSADILHALKSNEDGDAWIFVGLQKDKFSFDHSLNKWFEWNGHYWMEDVLKHVWTAQDCIIEKYLEEASLQAQAKHVAVVNGNSDGVKKAEALEKELLKRITNLQTLYRKRNILDLASKGKGSLGIKGDEWDRHNMLLACPNGIIELTSGQIRAGNPREYIMTVVPTEWRGLEEKAPIWERFLLDIMEEDQEMVSYIQRFLGYSITGETRDHVIFIMHGPNGRNGKGTMLETLRFVLGSIIGPIPAEMLLSDGRLRSSSGPSPDIMALRGRRLAWASESEEGRRLDVSRVKLLTGADTLTARPPHGARMIEFSPTHKLFLLTNHSPSLSGTDNAMWDRIHLIPFNLSYVDDPKKKFERKRDPLLPEKLRAEAPGILAWLVKGCLEWQRIGLKPPKKVLMATAQYREDEDILGHFINECTQPDPRGKIKAKELYDTYKSWCDSNGHKPLNNTEFGINMRKRDYKKKGGSTGHHYLGIALAPCSPEHEDH